MLSKSDRKIKLNVCDIAKKSKTLTLKYKSKLKLFGKTVDTAGVKDYDLHVTEYEKPLIQSDGDT